MPLIYNNLSKVITISFFSFSLIFFRANTFTDAVYVITHLFKNIQLQFSGLNMGLERKEFFIAIIGVLILELVQYIQGKGFTQEKLNSKPIYIRWSLYYILICSILFFANSSSTQFIYFQF